MAIPGIHCLFFVKKSVTFYLKRTSMYQERKLLLMVWPSTFEQHHEIHFVC